MPESQWEIVWIDRGLDTLAALDPACPTGVDLDLSRGRRPACRTALPSPARRCGYYRVTCRRCGLRAFVTTAGRPDDPCALRVACKGRPPDAADRRGPDESLDGSPRED